MYTINNNKTIKGFFEKNKVCVIYITETARILAEKIKDNLKTYFNIDIKYYSEYKKEIEKNFKKYDILLYIMASGIAIRSIAPYIVDKLSDPGIVVVDERCRNAVSLLGGHIGGANEMVLILSEELGINPVITTATDTNNLGSIDMISKYLNVDHRSNPMFREITLNINSSIVNGNRVKVYAEGCIKDYIENEIPKRYTKGVDIVDISQLEMVKNIDRETEVLITDRADLISKYIEKIYILIPKKNAIGVGCRKNTDKILFEETVKSYLHECNKSVESIALIGTIDIKKEEECIHEFAKKYGINEKFFSKDELDGIDKLYDKSDFVKSITGVYSVCEPSCHILTDGKLLYKAKKENGVTVALGTLI